MTWIPLSGIATIYTPRRFYFFMRRTIISHSIEAFRCNQGASRPWANPEPCNQKARATFVRQTWLSLFYQLFAFDKVVSILFSGF